MMSELKDNAVLAQSVPVFDDHDFEKDNVSETISASGSSVVPRRQLGFLQTTAMQLNNSLATGDFWITPYYTLALVRSKRDCLLLWAAGGIYAAFGRVGWNHSNPWPQS